MAGDFKGQMIASVLLATLSVALGIIPFFIMHRIVVDVMAGTADFKHTSPLAVAAGVCLVMKVLTSFRSTVLSHRVAYRILFNIRISLAKKFVDLPLGFVNKHASGTLKKIMVDDVEKLEIFLAHNIPETMSSCIVPVFIIVYMFFLDWRMALALLSTIPLSYIAFLLMMKDSNVKMQEFNDATEHVNGTIVEYVKGMAVIKAFNQTTTSFEKYSHSLTRYLNYVLEWFEYCWPYMSAYFVLITAGIVVVLPAGAYFYTNGSLDMATYILFMLIALGFSKPFLKLSEFSDSIALITLSEQNINNTLKEKELYKTDLNLIPGAYDVKFSNIRFAYNEKEVLHKISFTAKQGTTTALVGPSGSGKSTIAKLIARFWDVNSGKLTIGGIEIKEINAESLMDMVSFVFQDVFLFNDSIMENIRIGKQGATDEAVVQAAKRAMCHDFILKTENGYKTVVGTDGNKLSGGERQRISIARALLRDAPIIVLDEATAFTDPENEDKIQESINNLIKNKTLIVIAHRLSTVMHSEKIIVLDEGHILGDGTHEELLGNSPLYRNMWNAHIDAMDWEFDIEGGREND
jgi:ATP-binding cassette subfamily B protein